MFSQTYFKYLIKKNKFLILFILLTNLIISLTGEDLFFSNGKEWLLFSLVISLSYVLPCINLSYIHDKKAVDAYFALPISRKKTIITELIFDILSIYLPYLISQIITAIIQTNLNLIHLLQLPLIVLIIVTTLVCFNSLLFSLANNSFDGVIMILAYSFLPLAIYLVIYIFTEVYIAGYSGTPLNFVYCFSPICLSCLNFSLIKEGGLSCLLKEGKIYLIFEISYMLLSSYLLIKSYIKRKTERANSASNELFAYPIIIYSYVFLIIFGICSNYSITENLISFLSEYIFLYLITFIIFVVAHFVYKRKFYFNTKLVIYYLSVVIICLLFCVAARNTNGFNLANKYHEVDEQTAITINVNYYNGGGVLNWVNKTLGTNETYISIDAVLNEDSKNQKALQEESIAIVEKYRQIGIEQFYQEESLENSCSMSITFYHNQNKFNERTYQYHSFDDVLTIKEILTLAKDKQATVYLYADGNEYLINERGEFIIYTYEIYETSYGLD